MGKILSVDGCTNANSTADFDPQFDFLEMNRTHINNVSLTASDAVYVPYFYPHECQKWVPLSTLFVDPRFSQSASCFRARQLRVSSERIFGILRWNGDVDSQAILRGRHRRRRRSDHSCFGLCAKIWADTSRAVLHIFRRLGNIKININKYGGFIFFF